MEAIPKAKVKMNARLKNKMDKSDMKDYLANSSLRHILWRNLELEFLESINYAEPILDVACGDGFFGNKLFNKKKIMGFDISLNEVKVAEGRDSYRQIFVADACAMPIKGRSFRTVFSNSVFEHIPQVSQALKEVSRVLKDDGSFIFTIPNDKFSEYLLVGDVLRRLGFSKLSEAYKKKVNVFLKHRNLDSLDIWSQRLGGVGLKIVKTVYYLPKRAVYLWDFLFLPAYISDCFYRIFKKRINFPFRARLSSFFNGLAQRWQGNHQDGAAMVIIAVKDNNHGN